MKASPATRPCAEFPCDNPRLHANQGRANEPTGAPPEVDGIGASVANAAASNEFDWATTDYWVNEVKRRWSLAKADAPEISFPVLDALGLESSARIDERPALDFGDDALALDESIVLTESGVVLGELLVMPSETLFDEDERALTTSALALEVREWDGDAPLAWSETFGHLESGEVPRVADSDSGIENVRVELSSEDNAPRCGDALHPESDPFIAELLSLVPSEMSGAGGDDAWLTALALPTPAGGEVERSGEVRSLPAVAASRVSAPPVANELFVMPPGVQPLVPLQLDLTPTPAGLSPWSELTGVLSRHLMNGGHTRAAALVGPLLCGELVDLGRVEPAAVERLLSDGVAEARGGRVVTTANFRHAAKAFREEFSTGGLNASDALFWLSQLLVALCGGAGDEETFEAELRELGITKLLERAA